MTSKFCFSFTKIKNKYISIKRFPALFKKDNYLETSTRYVYSIVIFLSHQWSWYSSFKSYGQSHFFSLPLKVERKWVSYGCITVLSLWEDLGRGAFMPKTCFLQTIQLNRWPLWVSWSYSLSRNEAKALAHSVFLKPSKHTLYTKVPRLS